MRSLRRRPVAIAAVAITALSVLAIPIADAAPATPVDSAVAGTQDPAKLAALQEISTAMDRDPTHFAGMVTDGAQKNVTVSIGADLAIEAPTPERPGTRVLIRVGRAHG